MALVRILMAAFLVALSAWQRRLPRAIDSFSPRGHQGQGNVAREQAGDAFEALHYLNGLPQVRAFLDGALKE